jgi:mRNA interferase MazF
MAAIEATPETGLKIQSTVRFDKLTTLDKSVITGRIGNAPAAWLGAQTATFFGFDR